MEEKISERIKVKRVPKRGQYDKETIYKVLDSAFVCHVGFVVNGQPFVIPTAYGRKDGNIFIHGAVTSRMLVNLQKDIPVCLTTTLVDGIVLARSAFHSSMNYRSAVIFGTAELVKEEKEKNEALEIISENILKGRWQECRGPFAKELKGTTILRIKIDEASSKIRTGGPIDEPEDYKLPIWAGVVPMTTVYGEPIEDSEGKMDVDIPLSVKELTSK